MHGAPMLNPRPASASLPDDLVLSLEDMTKVTLAPRRSDLIKKFENVDREIAADAGTPIEFPRPESTKLHRYAKKFLKLARQEITIFNHSNQTAEPLETGEVLERREVPRQRRPHAPRQQPRLKFRPMPLLRWPEPGLMCAEAERRPLARNLAPAQ